ncbi:MAG: hypothetical protein QG599_524 [Pseudomonadota bacterium]|nr:hypothetical protein [Pseudomonadota bacterium]
MSTFAETGFTVSPQANTASPAAFVGFDRSLGYCNLLWEILPTNAALKQFPLGDCRAVRYPSPV